MAIQICKCFHDDNAVPSLQRPVACGAPQHCGILPGTNFQQSGIAGIAQHQQVKQFTVVIIL